MKLCQTINYFISIQKLKLHSWINVFTCSWYVSYTYQSSVGVHITDTHHKRIAPEYWSRLGRNRYGANGYSLTHISSLLSLRVLYSYLCYILNNMKPPFQELSTVFKVNVTPSKILPKMKLQAEKSDFKSEYLFPTCSVAINLVPALKLFLMCHATMLYQFGQFRNSSIITPFFQFNSAATSSATSCYRTVPERLGHNEEPARRYGERTGNKLSSIPKCI